MPNDIFPRGFEFALSTSHVRFVRYSGELPDAAAAYSHTSPSNRHQYALSESARVAASIARRKHRAASALCCSCARWNRSQRSFMFIDVTSAEARCEFVTNGYDLKLRRLLTTV